MSSVFIFDAYGTLFDVHAAIARHRQVVGPDADRVSATWRSKQLEYSWTLTLAGHYMDFWVLTERALDYARRALEVNPNMDGVRRSLMLLEHVQEQRRLQMI